MKKRILIVLLVLGVSMLTFQFSRKQLSPAVNYEPTYPVIKLDENQSYLGKGQERVSNQDGYFTVFSTMEPNQKTFLEYKQNGDASWSKRTYWDGTMAEYGCGITAMSILLSGYHFPDTPEDLRKKYYPHLEGDQMAEELWNTFGIKNSGFLYDSVSFSKKKILEHLNTNRPILVCVWNRPKENRWTTASHYLLLLAATEEGMVYVSNPNGLDHNSKSSGWYPIDEITPYLAKIMYIEQ